MLTSYYAYTAALVDLFGSFCRRARRNLSAATAISAGAYLRHEAKELSRSAARHR
jgi:hypothetical protein